ncbi:MAG TPA: ATPase inhibitor subunit zeta [Pseudolabrys sp.]|nr:ATPase inhibitor subunit zeta [Pseudolabrys sp.]
MIVRKRSKSSSGTRRISVFRITARANRLFGEWAADLLGLSELEKEGYVETVVHAQFEEPGVVAKMLDDLRAKGVAATEADLRFAASAGRFVTASWFVPDRDVPRQLARNLSAASIRASAGDL